MSILSICGALRMSLLYMQAAPTGLHLGAQLLQGRSVFPRSASRIQSELCTVFMSSYEAAAMQISANAANDLRGGPGNNSVKTPSRLELSISCNGISPQSRLRSRVAVQVGVYQQKLHVTSRHRRRSLEVPYMALGQTEVINGQQPATPVFLQRIPVEYFFEEVQPMRFDVYDVEDSTKNMEAQTYIGSATLALAEIVAAPKRALTKSLIRAGNSPSAQSGALKKAGTITIVANEVEEAKISVTFELAARGLEKQDLIGTSDPSTQLRMCRSAEGEWAVVYRSEVKEHTAAPSWKSFTLSVQQLNRGDPERPIRLELWHAPPRGKEEMLGSVQGTVLQLQEKKDWSLTVASRSRRRRTEAILSIKAQAKQEHTFLDYIAGGTDIQLMVAIDFTASNGDPSYPSSLHFRSAEGNEYTRAITAVADILLKYDSDQKVPVYGFGAKQQANESISHCFALEPGADKTGEVVGMQGMIRAYNSALNRLTFFGPTHFAPIVRHAAALAGNSVTQEHQRYLMLLIVTDGEIAYDFIDVPLLGLCGIYLDYAATVEALVDASRCALSIVIVGVGEADFSNMRGLDSDEVLLSYNGRVAERDVVQFVAFRDYKQTHSSRLAADVLAEIPTQFLSYMKVRNILPGNGRKAQAAIQSPMLAVSPSAYTSAAWLGHQAHTAHSPSVYPYVPLLEVTHDFVAAGPDQLSVRTGDVLEWLYAPNAEWTYGRSVATRIQGYFPSSYVRPKAP